MIVAIDGPAASGKGTLAKRLAAHFGLHHLDTGLLYRAVARDVQRLGGALDDPVAATAAAVALDPESLEDASLRKPGAGEAASIVARIPEVRAQRRYLETKGRGEPATYEGVLAEIRRRDERDAGRDASPMRPAADAFLLDTSNLDIEAAFDTAVGVILRKAGQRGRA